MKNSWVYFKSYSISFAGFVCSSAGHPQIHESPIPIPQPLHAKNDAVKTLREGMYGVRVLPERRCPESPAASALSAATSIKRASMAAETAAVAATMVATNAESARVAVVAADVALVRVEAIHAKIEDAHAKIFHASLESSMQPRSKKR